MSTQKVKQFIRPAREPLHVNEDGIVNESWVVDFLEDSGELMLQGRLAGAEISDDQVACSTN